MGMIQLFDQPDAVEVGEIQIQPNHQNQGIGGRVLKDTIPRVHEQRKKVLLSVVLKNERAYRLYERLGFQRVAHNDTQISWPATAELMCERNGRLNHTGLRCRITCGLRQISDPLAALADLGCSAACYDDRTDCLEQ